MMWEMPSVGRGTSRQVAILHPGDPQAGGGVDKAEGGAGKTCWSVSDGVVTERRFLLRAPARVRRVDHSHESLVSSSMSSNKYPQGVSVRAELLCVCPGK